LYARAEPINPAPPVMRQVRSLKKFPYTLLVIQSDILLLYTATGMQLKLHNTLSNTKEWTMTRLNTADTMSYANSKESSPIVE
jgi:hypothetical protein